MRILALVLVFVWQTSAFALVPFSSRSGAYQNRNLLDLSETTRTSQRQTYLHAFQPPRDGSSSVLNEGGNRSWIELSWMLSIGLMLFSVTAATPPALATTTLAVSALEEYDVNILNHQYADPRHPQCRRTIRVDRDGRTFHYSGGAVGKKDDPVARGCSPEEVKEFGFRAERMDGQILPGLVLNADDGVLEGKWEPAKSTDDFDGIRWQDGNKWIVADEPKTLSKTIGESIFLAYIGFSTLAGVKGVTDKIQEKRNQGKTS